MYTQLSYTDSLTAFEYETWEVSIVGKLWPSAFI